MAAKLRRSLGLAELTFFGVGTIVGAGIYSVIGAAAGKAGAALWVSFALAALAALLAALSYAELSSMLPRAGAEYQYLKAAFPRIGLLASLAGYLIGLNAAGTAATVALAFGGYLKALIPIPVPVTALALLTACTLVNLAGIRQSTWITIALIAIEVSGLLAMIGGGFIAGDVGSALARSFQGFDAAGVFAATALLFFMFIGFEDTADLSEEAKHPRRDIPRALLLSAGITAVIYLLVCFAVLAVAPPDVLSGSESPLTDAGRRVAPWLGTMLAVTALFATATTALITLISISRLLFAMGRDGDMPAVLAAVLPGRKTPWVAALALFAVSAAMLPLGGVEITASVSALGLLCVFVGVQAALIALRFKRPGVPRPFRLRWTVGGVPVAAAAGIAVSMALLTQFDWRAYAVLAATIAVGLTFYFFRRRK
jgi:basic amino acid/polyamine antiporter, APA family